MIQNCDGAAGSPFSAGDDDCFPDCGNIEEYIMLRLRLAEGLTNEGMKAKFGIDIPKALRERAASPVMRPYCSCDDRGIRLTRKGMLISNAIICDLIELL